MRRKDKEITDESGIKAVIKKSAVCRLGMINGDRPYIVPLSFGFHENALYFHGALKGLKIDLIKENPNVCFEFDTLIETISSENACDFSQKYQSVIGTGQATLLENLDEKRQALDIIKTQYSDKQFEFPENRLKATAVIKVDIESMTGKQSGF
jgi:nitroimidazol reductase NimA-like FMN-containing flavoprotein (pyridoxamine 5'-phosphate oxidase superfamily)